MNVHLTGLGDAIGSLPIFRWTPPGGAITLMDAAWFGICTGAVIAAGFGALMLLGTPSSATSLRDVPLDLCARAFGIFAVAAFVMVAVMYAVMPGSGIDLDWHISLIDYQGDHTAATALGAHHAGD